MRRQRHCAGCAPAGQILDVAIGSTVAILALVTKFSDRPRCWVSLNEIYSRDIARPNGGFPADAGPINGAAVADHDG